MLGQGVTDGRDRALVCLCHICVLLQGSGQFSVCKVLPFGFLLDEPQGLQFVAKWFELDFTKQFPSCSAVPCAGPKVPKMVQAMNVCEAVMCALIYHLVCIVTGAALDDADIQLCVSGHVDQMERTAIGTKDMGRRLVVRQLIFPAVILGMENCVAFIL